VSSRPAGSAALETPGAPEAPAALDEVVCAAPVPLHRNRQDAAIPAQNAATRRFRNSAATPFGACNVNSNGIVIDFQQ
jgi:hypothetical protein